MPATQQQKKLPCLISPVPHFLSEEVSLCGLCPSLGHDGQEEEKSWEEQLDAHQEQLEKEMQEARRMVFRLQVSPGDKTFKKQAAQLL